MVQPHNAGIMYEEYFYSIVFTIVLLFIMLVLHAVVFYPENFRNAVSSRPAKLISAGLLLTVFLITLLAHLLVLLNYFSTVGGVYIFIKNAALFLAIGTGKILYLDGAFASTAGQILTAMLGIVVIAIYYTVVFSRVELLKFLSYCLAIFLSGILFITTTNLIVMFIAYEAILVPTVMVLEFFSKTTRSREATIFMIF